MSVNDAAGLHVSVALCKHRGPVNAVIWNSLCCPSFFSVRCCSHIAPTGTGEYCMTGGSDGDIHLWNPQSARLIKTYPGHARSVLSLALFAYDSPHWCMFSMFHSCAHNQSQDARQQHAREQR